MIEEKDPRKMAEDEDLERIKRKKMEQLMGTEKQSMWTEGAVVELTAANFKEALAQTSRPVLVDFWAGWCAPCMVMKPVLEAMAKDHAGRVYFAKVDVDRNQTLARRYGIMGIPHFILFKNGRPVDRVVGAVGRARLEAFLSRHLS